MNPKTKQRKDIMEKVLVDIDGVIVNLMEGLRQVLSEKGITFNIEGIDTYNFKGNIGCDRSEVFAAMEDVRTFEKSPMYEGALEALEKLKTITIVEAYTKVSNSEIYNHRNEFIKNYGLTGMPYIGDKPIIDNVSSVFEDCQSNLEKWIDTDADLYLIDYHNYNKNISNKLANRIIYCKSFSEAVDKFIKNYIEGTELRNKRKDNIMTDAKKIAVTYEDDTIKELEKGLVAEFDNDNMKVDMVNISKIDLVRIAYGMMVAVDKMGMMPLLESYINGDIIPDEK